MTSAAGRFNFLCFDNLTSVTWSLGPGSFLLLWSGLFHLLVLTPYCEAAHVHRDGDDYFGVPGWLPGFVVDVSGLDPFPLGAPVLEPDLREREDREDTKKVGHSD